jgi:hypothetical protein
MSQYDRLDVYMKILEVMEKEFDSTRVLSAYEKTRATTIIERLEGTLHLSQGEITMGDRFQNITSFVIATRGSIAKGVIAVREHHGPNVADAIQQLEQAVSTAVISEEMRQEALELIQGLTAQAASDRPTKSVLKSLGSSLLTTLKSIGSIAEVVSKTWPAISSLWA